MADRVLSQHEIDNVFRNLREQTSQADPGRSALPYDFRRPDRIAKEQLRSIHVLHENFARSLAASLSAYLRAYVIVNLVSVEQLSFVEFSQCLPSPSCVVSLGMRPFENNALLELNPAMVFPVIEILLGGTGVGSKRVNREITEIEQSILDGLFRILLKELRDAWLSVIAIDFTIDGYETEPQLLQILAPNEAVVAVSMEVRFGEVAGMMNIAIPSIIVKMLRQKFDQQWSVRKSEATEVEHARILRLIRPATMAINAQMRGPTLRVEDLMELAVGDLLMFDYPVERSLDLLVNGKLKHAGQVVTTGQKKAFLLIAPLKPADEMGAQRQ